MAASGVKISRIGPFEYNPRGNIWFKDENTFGHRLLSKMGWNHGKGLGRNEDGIKENIKISKKDNNAGVGFKNDANIAVGCLEYENILSKLQHHFKKDETKWDLDSLEQRSRKSSNRLHYQKFVRGKDLYRYSEKDMKCIFLDNPQESSNDESEKNEDMTFKSQLNMKEYFALKMKQKLDNLPKVNPEKISHHPVDQQQHCSSEPVSTKKRKKAEKSKKVKRIKLECEEVFHEAFTTPHAADPKKENNKEFNISEMTSSPSKISKLCKKIRSKKKKLGKIKKLKSCLKNKSTYYLGATKNVSFNDVVDYKMFDSTTDENNSSIINNEMAECDSDIHGCENKQGLCASHLTNASACISSFEVNGENDISNSNNTTETEVNDSPLDSLHLSESNLENISTREQLGDDRTSGPESSTSEEQPPQCLDLPKNSGSKHNAWLESQRQAMKMKLYKGMIKNLQKHDILSTTNLLDIKGYGNWGY